MKSNKLIAIIISACISTGFYSPTIVHAQDDNGKIDLYEIFSSKADRMKTDVGSRIYKWSMHLPDDGIVYKSDQANYFNMSSSSYQTNIQLQVEKNRDNLSLEELLYQMQSNNINYYFPMYYNDKEYSVDILIDENGQKYIRTIKSNLFYDYMLIDQAAEELGDYTENRVYIANNYIYNMTVSMNGKNYKDHEEMFNKLANSFKVSFDESNPYIKELSDSVSGTREYKNTSYGWKMLMSPYWKIQGAPNARTQVFQPVYTDEELNNTDPKNNMNSNEMMIQDGITVNLVSSAKENETASSWASKELQTLTNNYNKEVYDVLSSGSQIQNGLNVYHNVIRYKTVTNKPYIIDNLYVIANGYKYLISATMDESKYLDSIKKADFDKMMNSFTPDKSYLSRYLGKILDAQVALDISLVKDIKLSKYDFATKVTKNWNTYSYGNAFYYGEMYYKFMNTGYDPTYRGNISNNEYSFAVEPKSNMRLDLSAGLNASEIKDIVKQSAQDLSKNDEVRIGLAKVNITSSEYQGVELYCIQKEYDLPAINKFVKEDKTKAYNLLTLQNQYQYIVKIGTDIYTENITLPVANTTDTNRQKLNSIWENTTIKGVNYSKSNINWVSHSLEEYTK